MAQSLAAQHGTPLPTDDTLTEEVTVLVTGFGDFNPNYATNPSFVIASSLPSVLLPTPAHPSRIRLLVHQTPIHVAYRTVLDLVPKLLSPPAPASRPDIVLHIGMASRRAYYSVERSAHRDGYDEFPDVDGDRFRDEESAVRWAGCPAALETSFGFEDVWRRWRSDLADPALDLRPSDDAGHFVCDFIYYTSLAWFYQQEDGGGDESDRPVMFLHVPADLQSEEDVTKGREVTVALIRALVDSRRQHQGQSSVVKKSSS